MNEPTPAPADGLAAGLAAEYALIYAYGRAGVELGDKAALDIAADAENTHRDLRDRLTEYMAGLGQLPPPPEAAYTVVDPLTNEGEAVALLTKLEDATAATWRTVVSATAGDDRRHAVDGLSNAATRAAVWRRWRGEQKAAATFPGA
ncbi:ferritin-like domain-containing protein [Phytomonospora sp. NPDC050363]|uniref:ferritin-like domain-containing protein n=1 Tax=Phytomonospora sp. NPDC050363 TaxID=3155642 RepID=UPI0033F7789F